MIEYTNPQGETMQFFSEGEQQQDNMHSTVDHPSHYNRENAMECIDEMVLVFGKEATAHFCLLNCWKYRYRAGQKGNAIEDLQKSDWYLTMYKKLRETSNFEKPGDELFR